MFNQIRLPYFIILFNICLIAVVGPIGCANNRPPEISDQNQKYENQYFSILYPEGWDVKEIFGPDRDSFIPDGMIENATQRYGSNVLGRIYFFDPQYARYKVLFWILAADEHTKEVINNTSETDMRGFEREYRGTKFNKFSTSSNEISLGGTKGLKQVYVASDDEGHYEKENMIVLTTKDFIYNIVFDENSNFPDKTTQRINDIVNSFSLPLTAQSNYQKEVVSSQNNYQSNELNLSDAKYYNNRGIAETQQGDYLQALSDFNKAISLNPKASIYCNRGFMNENQGNLAQALDDYNKAIELDPNLAQAYGYRGYIYNQQGNNSQALADFDKAIELDPQLAQAYSYRGLIYFEMGYQKNDAEEENRAFDDLNKAIGLDPQYGNAYTNRGFVYYMQNNFSRALVDQTKAVELKPNEAGAYENRAVTYYQLHNYDNSWSDVHKSEELGHAVEPNFLNNLKKDSGRDQ